MQNSYHRVGSDSCGFSEEIPKTIICEQVVDINLSHGCCEPRSSSAQVVNTISETAVRLHWPKANTHTASPDPARAARISQTFLQSPSVLPIRLPMPPYHATLMSFDDCPLYGAAPSSAVWLLQAQALVAEAAADVRSRGGGEHVAAIMSARLGPDGRLQVGGYNPSTDRPLGHLSS